MTLEFVWISSIIVLPSVSLTEFCLEKMINIKGVFYLAIFICDFVKRTEKTRILQEFLYKFCSQKQPPNSIAYHQNNLYALVKIMI